MSEMSDFTLGLIIMPFFLVFIFTMGYGIYRVKNAILTREWTPLRPLLEGGGTVNGDGGGGATSYLTGRYRGRRVQASMSPDVAKYSGESGHYANRFTVALLDVPGAENFRITAAPSLPRFWRSEWRVDAANEALREALEATRAVAQVSAFGDVEVSYDRSTRMLQFVEDVRPLKVPPRDRFQQEVDLLIELADLVEPLNLAPHRPRTAS
jgi:hypothetical protein